MCVLITAILHLSGLFSKKAGVVAKAFQLLGKKGLGSILLTASNWDLAQEISPSFLHDPLNLKWVTEILSVVVMFKCNSAWISTQHRLKH